MLTQFLAAALLLPGVTVPGRHDACCPLSPTEGTIARIVDLAWQTAGSTPQQTAPQQPQPAKLTRAEQSHQNDLKSDAELGKQFAAEVDKELKPSTNQEYIDRLNRVVAKLMPIVKKEKVEVLWGDKRLNPFEYSIKIVQNKEVNAFSLPGGYIYVFEGLMAYVESDDELAAVLAHEIAHASFRHMATLVKERNKIDQLTIPLILVILAGGDGAGDTGSALLTLQNLLLQAKTSGWGQDAERAADYGAFQYLRFTDYNPVGMLTFLEKLGRDQRTLESIDWGIYRTHPPSRERATLLEGYLNKANIPIRRSEVSTSFRVLPKELEGGKIELRFNNRLLLTLAGEDAKSRADAMVPELNRFFDAVPDLFDVSASTTNTIVWQREPLLRITEADAEASGKSVAETTTQVLRALKRELYVLAYRIWETR